MSFREKLAKRTRKAGLILSSSVISGLEAYFELLAKWNEKVSLTSLRVSDAGEEAVDRLLLEPILAAKYFPSQSSAVLDIGSGGGSPAIPMKIFRPDISMLMVESKTRKAAFLRDVVRQLKLERTEVLTSRFESLFTKLQVVESLDVVTMRAVRVEPKTLAGIRALLRPGGYFFLFRTGSGGGPPALGHGLNWEGNQTLIPQLNSVLSIFRRTS